MWLPLLLVSLVLSPPGDSGKGLTECHAFASLAPIQRQTRRERRRATPTVIMSTKERTTRLHMNFFSRALGSLQKTMNTGGSYNLGIDYESLDFPGPEVGRMAVEITSGIRNAQKSGVSNSDSDNDSDAAAAMIHPSVSPSLPHLELATFAGGCFWGLELALRRKHGIEHTLVGYTQGDWDEIRPNYEQVSAGNTGHCEAVLVYYDPRKTSYRDILRRVYLERVDVTTVNGQGRDFGKHYRTGIYFHTPEQEATARELLLRAETATDANTAAPVATELKPAGAFWPAEEYHQRYLEKGGRFGNPQSAEKGNTDEIRCYG